MKNAFFISLFTLILFSCKKDSDNNEIIKDVLQPLEVGFTWTFEDSYYSPDGQILGKDTTKLGITGSKFIEYEGDSIEVFYWNWTEYPSNEFSEEKWLCNSINNELFYYGGIIKDSLFIFEKSLAAKLSVEENESWVRNVYNYSGGVFFNAGTSDIVCNSKNEIVETGIGNLECFKYDETRIVGEDQLIYETYYCKNIGLVGVKMIRNDVINYEKKLISYDLSSFKSGLIQTIEKGNIFPKVITDIYNVKSKMNN